MAGKGSFLGLKDGGGDEFDFLMDSPKGKPAAASGAPPPAAATPSLGPGSGRPGTASGPRKTTALSALPPAPAMESDGDDLLDMLEDKPKPRPTGPPSTGPGAKPSTGPALFGGRPSTPSTGPGSARPPATSTASSSSALPKLDEDDLGSSSYKPSPSTGPGRPTTAAARPPGAGPSLLGILAGGGAKKDPSQPKHKQLASWYKWLGLDPDRPEDKPFLHLAKKGQATELPGGWEERGGKFAKRGTATITDSPPTLAELQEELERLREEAKRPKQAAKPPTPVKAPPPKSVAPVEEDSSPRPPWEEVPPGEETEEVPPEPVQAQPVPPPAPAPMTYAPIAPAKNAASDQMQVVQQLLTQLQQAPQVPPPILSPPSIPPVASLPIFSSLLAPTIAHQQTQLQQASQQAEVANKTVQLLVEEREKTTKQIIDLESSIRSLTDNISLQSQRHSSELLSQQATFQKKIDDLTSQLGGLVQKTQDFHSVMRAQDDDKVKTELVNAELVILKKRLAEYEGKEDQIYQKSKDMHEREVGLLLREKAVEEDKARLKRDREDLDEEVKLSRDRLAEERATLEEERRRVEEGRRSLVEATRALEKDRRELVRGTGDLAEAGAELKEKSEEITMLYQDALAERRKAEQLYKEMEEIRRWRMQAREQEERLAEEWRIIEEERAKLQKQKKQLLQNRAALVGAVRAAYSPPSVPGPKADSYEPTSPEYKTPKTSPLSGTSLGATRGFSEGMGLSSSLGRSYSETSPYQAKLRRLSLEHSQGRGALGEQDAFLESLGPR